MNTLNLSSNTTTTTNSLSLSSAQAQPAASVQLKSLQLAYAGKPVLAGLDWQLLPGQVVGLLGRNGVGKSTLLESMLGLREISDGEIRLFGQPLDQMDDAMRARIGFVPQQSQLFEWLTPRQLLAYFKSFYPKWNQAKADGLMSRWEIPADQLISKLSGGQQQRLSIVRALAPEPDLLVLDEPVASLDPVGRRDFLRELVEQVLDRGTTVVFSTHILSDLERVAFNVAFMARGKISLQAPLSDLMDDCRRFSGLASRVDAHVRAQQLNVLSRRALDGGAVAVLATGDHGQLSEGVSSDKLNLDDLFAELTQ